MRTAGRTVAFSAATVAVALAALTAFPLGFIKSMGIAGAVGRGRGRRRRAGDLSCGVRALGRQARPQTAGRGAEEQGRWYRLAHAVMRRPGAVALATGVVMLALAAPALRAEWTPIDSSVIPTDKSSRTVADTVECRLRRDGRQPDDGGDLHRARTRRGRGGGVRRRGQRPPGRGRRRPPGPARRDDLAARRHRAGRPRRARRRSSWSTTPGRSTAGTGSTRWSPGRPRTSSTSSPRSAAGCPLAARAPHRPDLAGAVADDRVGRAAGQGGR